jgi:hypothetical protein
MSKRLVTVFFLAGGPLWLVNCSHYYYAPNVQQVPMFTQKNELQISGFSGAGNEITTNDVQVAYSITDHIAIMGSGMWANGQNSSKTSFGNGRYTEGALGYFSPFEKYGVFEFYAGAGTSKQHHQYDSAQTMDLSFSKFFVQPSIGIKKNAFECAVSMRASYINFTQVQGNYVSPDIPLKQGYVFFEPAITLRTGVKFIKFQAQWQLALPVTSRQSTFSYSGTMINLGVQLVIARHNLDQFRKKTDSNNTAH